MDIWNSDYVLRGLSTHEVILIDTSSLLNPNIDKFIQKYETRFLEQQRKITVIKPVCYELAKFLGSNDDELSVAAMNALSLIKKYSSLFEVKNEDMDEEEIKHAFADKDIYNYISVGRGTHSYMLISNDRALSADVFKLNELKSIRGKNIWVCYIHSSGELQRCECAKTKQPIAHGTEQLLKENAEIENATSDTPTKDELHNSSNTDVLFGASCGLAGAVLGFCIGKWGKVAFNILRSCIA